MRAKKSLGQNFLRDVSVCERIVGELDLQPTDTIIEIGPGRGALTTHLLDSGARVIAVEFDRDLIPPLRVQFSGSENLELINLDALNVDLAGLVGSNTPAKLVANLPYNISTAILQRLIEQRMSFSRIVLMFQREVVERITAQPASKERGFLSVIAQDAFEIEHLFDVAPSAFVPVPKIWSAVVALVPKDDAYPDAASLRHIVSAGFCQRRKTIYNNLRLVLADARQILAAGGIDASRRAETLTLEEWRKLAGAALRSGGAPAIRV